MVELSSFSRCDALRELDPFISMSAAIASPLFVFSTVMSAARTALLSVFEFD